jgi:hypothetical protein
MAVRAFNVEVARVWDTAPEPRLALRAARAMCAPDGAGARCA